MADQRVHFNRFDGGLSDDDYQGVPNSASIATAINTRKSPGLITLHPQLQKESGSVVTTEIQDALRLTNNNIIMAGGSKLYQRAPGTNGGPGTYTTYDTSPNLTTGGGKGFTYDGSQLGVGQIAGQCYDLDYRQDLDMLFAYSATSIHSYSKVASSNMPAYQSFGTYPININLTTGGVYTLPTALDETKKLLIGSLDAEPVFSVAIKVDTLGSSGDLTLVLHDGSNTVIGTQTIPYANLKVGGQYNEWIFNVAAGIRAKPGNPYHVHLYASAGTHTIITDSTNDISGACSLLIAQRLVDAGADGHRTLQVGAKTYICNERYLAEWEFLDTTLYSNAVTSGYKPHRLEFSPDYKTIGLAAYNEYLATAIKITSSSDTTASVQGTGAIILWNTTDLFLDFVIPVPQGVPNSLFSMGNVLYFEAGGRWCRWPSRNYFNPEQPVDPFFELSGVDLFIPGTGGDAPAVDNYLRAPRQGAAMRENVLLLGYPYQTGNTNVNIGVYGYGALKAGATNIVNFEQTISTGSQFTQFDTTTSPDTPVTGITLVKQFGTNTLVAWKDIVNGVTTYGVDYSNESSPAASSGRYVGFQFDNKEPDKEKAAKAIKAVCQTLPAGCVVTPLIFLDGATTPMEGENPAIVGNTESVMTMPENDHWYYARWGIDITSSKGNYPFIRSISFKFDDRKDDQNNTEVNRAA